MPPGPGYANGYRSPAPASIATAPPGKPSGPAKIRSWVFSWDHITTRARSGSTPDEWLDLGEQEGPFLLRTPDGKRIVCSVSGMSMRRGKGGIVWSGSFTAVRTGG